MARVFQEGTAELRKHLDAIRDIGDWDIVNGVTAYARSVPHTDDRVNLEKRAGKLMEIATAS